MLNRRCVQFFGQCDKHGFSCGAIVRKHPHLDQAKGVQSGIGLFFNGIGQAVTTNHDDRVKVMGIGTMDFALGRGELDLRHACIIGEPETTSTL